MTARGVIGALLALFVVCALVFGVVVVAATTSTPAVTRPTHPAAGTIGRAGESNR